MAYRHLSCSLEQLAASSHLCALAACCSASPCASQSSITWHGAWIPGVQFSPGVSKGMWETVQGQLNVAEFPEKLLETWKYEDATQPSSPEILSL